MFLWFLEVSRHHSAAKDMTPPYTVDVNIPRLGAGVVILVSSIVTIQCVPIQVNADRSPDTFDIGVSGSVSRLSSPPG